MASLVFQLRQRSLDVLTGSIVQPTRTQGAEAGSSSAMGQDTGGGTRREESRAGPSGGVQDTGGGTRREESRAGPSGGVQAVEKAVVRRVAAGLLSKGRLLL